MLVLGGGMRGGIGGGAPPHKAVDHIPQSDPRPLGRIPGLFFASASARYARIAEHEKKRQQSQHTTIYSKECKISEIWRRTVIPARINIPLSLMVF